MPLTNQQIEAQKKKFHAAMLEKEIVLPYLVSGQNGGAFTDEAVEEKFEVWLSAIESVEIEIPSGFIWDSENGDDVIYVNDMEKSIEQQGYKVKS